TLLNQLDRAKHRFESSDGEAVRKLLAATGRRTFSDPELLIRFHEQLLFIRAYPASRAVFQLADRLLSTFQSRVSRVMASADPAPFDYIENSGIAGTTLYGHYSYGVARWLARRRRDRVEVDWEGYEKTERLAYVWPRLLPLLEEDSLVEQNIPY